MRGSLPRLQQAHLHDEDSQHDENARDNVPEAHGVPLEGEWAVCERQHPLNVPIVMPEHSDGLSESEETKDTAEIELNSCQTSVDVHVHIDETSWHTGETETSS